MNTERPLENFTNSHAGIVMHLDRLSELPALLAPANLARKTAQQTLNFFRHAVYEHHADEEKTLFPAVLESAADAAERSTVQALVKALTVQHRALEALWEKIEPELKKIAKGSEHSLEAGLLMQLVTRYREHAAFEEAQFLPLSQQILGRNDNHMAALGISLHLKHAPVPFAHI
jgi:hemerythrin-like domain-containing protein